MRPQQGGEDECQHGPAHADRCEHGGYPAEQPGPRLRFGARVRRACGAAPAIRHGGQLGRMRVCGARFGGPSGQGGLRVRYGIGLHRDAADADEEDDDVATGGIPSGDPAQQQIAHTGFPARAIRKSAEIR